MFVLFQIVACSVRYAYLYDYYENKTTFNFNKSNKSHKYSGKNNFYK